MSKEIPVHIEFEDAVSSLLEEYGFKVRRLATPEDQGFDFQATHGNAKWIIEIKFYRTAHPQFSLLEAAASRLVNEASKMEGETSCMLVVSSNIPADFRLYLENEFGIIIADRSDLRIWSINSPELAERFSSIFEEEYTEKEDFRGRSFAKTVESKRIPKGQRQIDSRGSELCEELRKLPGGRSSWQQYEGLCIRILEYLFPGDLYGPKSQAATVDRLNRFDYIARIKPSTEFWRFLLEQLNSRYVLVEFKNYNDFITQGEILTTEKYLLERALRKVAIILSRKGAHENAMLMAQGAMRESGKLLLVLDDEKVYSMLRMRERGEDPSDLLFEWTDEFLMSLPR